MKTCDLAGEWRLCNESGKDFRDLQMNVPGDNFSALLRAGCLPDPYVGRAEADCQWVGRDDWSICRTFNFSLRPGQRHFLCMDMVDTFFEVFVNGKSAGKGNNYFRIWRFDVTDFLVNGENSIFIKFDSAERHACQEAEKLPYVVPVSAYDVFSPHRNLVRKIQCQSGWDWGPCLMVSGIYGNIFIDSVFKGYMENLCLETLPVVEGDFAGQWKCCVTARYNSFEDGKESFLFELTGNGISLVKSLRSEVKKGLNVIKTEFLVKEPLLWRSSDELKEAGLKENSLYNLLAAALDDRAADHMDCVMVKKVGFRVLKMNVIPDQHGTSLFYSLNGRGIFAKGANWVPLDALPERWTKKRYEYFLQSAVDANMNSLRFWGGGQYESEICYDICDRLGLIIWQDCMFACGLYPTNEEFLQNVAKEIEDNVYRLQSHASLALWCGNNEDFGALNWYKESRDARDRYLVDYDRLNHGVIERVVKECDPTRTWWPSSPCSGPNNFGDNWHDDSEGDMHFWSVWHEKKDMEAYLSIQPRFVSEFGYESLTSFEGIKEFCDEENLNLTSPVMEWHQRSPGGNSIILENFSRYFRIPNGFENVCYLSQVQQAVALKTAVDYWRSLRPRCMGATFWQMNDVWPVTSWSSMEYSGKWKLLQYAAKNFFNPLNLCLIKKDEKFFVCLINESQKKICADVKIYFVDFDGRILRSENVKKEIESDCAQYIFEENFCDRKIAAKENEYFIFAEMEVDGKLYEDTLFVCRWKKCNLKKAKVDVKVEKCGEGKFEIRLKSDRPDFYVSVEAGGLHGIFSENMFTLLPDREKCIFFEESDYGLENSGMAEMVKNLSAEDFARRLSVKGLRDSY